VEHHRSAHKHSPRGAGRQQPYPPVRATLRPNGRQDDGADHGRGGVTGRVVPDHPVKLAARRTGAGKERLGLPSTDAVSSTSRAATRPRPRSCRPRASRAAPTAVIRNVTAGVAASATIRLRSPQGQPAKSRGTGSARSPKSMPTKAGTGGCTPSTGSTASRSGRWRTWSTTTRPSRCGSASTQTS